MSCVELSENLPVAVNCCVDPAVIVGDCGEIVIETRTAGVTVSVADPVMLPEVAMIDAVPLATAVASPCEPEALLTVATAALEELHVEVVVMSCVLPSLKWPVAVNCCVVPAAMLTVGVTVMDCKTAVEPT